MAALDELTARQRDLEQKLGDVDTLRARLVTQRTQFDDRADTLESERRSLEQLKDKILRANKTINHNKKVLERERAKILSRKQDLDQRESKMNRKLDVCRKAYRDTVEQLRAKHEKLLRWQKDLERREKALEDDPTARRLILRVEHTAPIPHLTRAGK